MMNAVALVHGQMSGAQQQTYYPCVALDPEYGLWRSLRESALLIEAIPR